MKYTLLQTMFLKLAIKVGFLLVVRSCRSLFTIVQYLFDIVWLIFFNVVINVVSSAGKDYMEGSLIYNLVSQKENDRHNTNWL